MAFIKRRRLINALAFSPLVAWRNGHAKSSPSITHGFSIGEVTDQSAILWARVNGAYRLVITVSSTEDVTKQKIIQSDIASSSNDYNIKVLITGLAENTRYVVQCVATSTHKLEPGNVGETFVGEFKTAIFSKGGDIRFLWSGDTCGQGYGIDSQQGGLLTYKSMLERKPDFFVHCGDQIYADNPIEPEKIAEDGLVWKNWMEAGKLKVAESIQEFRENFYYNFKDEHLSNFHRNVPVYHMWDDHEVINNWYPGEILAEDGRYTQKNVDVLARNAQRAFVDCLPIDDSTFVSKPIYRKISRGPLLDLLFVDLRSYKGPNSENEQQKRSRETDFFGQTQLNWLKKELLSSKAIWKMICIDMPISVVVKEWGTNISENAANSDGPPAGRELEYLELLSFIKEHDIQNVHFITADVHYCASYHCSPERAVFKNFKPFWEFISGPLHAGTFGPNSMDSSFGPKAEFIGLPERYEPGCSPAAGLQFFGEIDIDATTAELTVSHYNRVGQRLWSKMLKPEVNRVKA